ncbi:Hypp8282 [Branchiostoma lanceolatum]|uniref:Hypp8282 protein n=1 Tax=Branchiostoma lanceolatum TaxID=7740 RepID=A0A8J9Z6E5_BRALA|nr:Hypp8282 [Branchiostoma lanceolatum]
MLIPTDNPKKLALRKESNSTLFELEFRQQVNIMRDILLHSNDIKDEDGMRPNRVLDMYAKGSMLTSELTKVYQINLFKYKLVATMRKRCYRKAQNIMDRMLIRMQYTGLLPWRSSEEGVSEPEVKSPRQVQDVNDQLVGEILNGVAEKLDKRYMSSESSGDEVQNPPRLNRVNPAKPDVCSTSQRVNPAEPDFCSTVQRVNPAEPDFCSTVQRVNPAKPDVCSTSQRVNPAKPDVCSTGQ